MTSPPTYPTDPSFSAPPPPTQQSTSGLAVAGLVLAFLLPLVGLIVSIIAIGKTGPGKAGGRGFAVAGLVVGALGTLIGLVVVIAIGAGIAATDETTVTDSAAEVAEVEPAEVAPGDVAASEEPAPAAEEADTDAPAVTEFTALSPEEWEVLVRDPESRAGTGVVFYAEVFQFDTNTGTDAFLANAGPDQPAAEFELEDNVFVSLSGDAGGQIAEGDVLKIEGVVDGVLDYETLIGGDNSVASISAQNIEVVGYADLTPDVQLSAPTPAEYGGADVDVTVTNSGKVPYTYSIDIVAESADGSTQYETTYASVDNLAPGQTATVSASFFDDLPADATLRVAAVERYDF